MQPNIRLLHAGFETDSRLVEILPDRYYCYGIHGVYWLPLYFILKERGFDVILVNARDVKNYSGRKTDEADAEWLMMLHSYGLLKCSFQPENEARAIRNLTRHRSSLLQSSSREA